VVSILRKAHSVREAVEVVRATSAAVGGTGRVVG
jgi:hypothetical protein